MTPIAPPSFPLTIEEAGRSLRSGEVTSLELIERGISRADALDGALGTYLLRFDDQARASAAIADEELARGIDRGPLHGIPLGIKDIIATDEGPTTAQSLILDPAWGDQGDAPVVARLRAAGAIVTGKTTTMEFACGMPDFDKPFPIPRNPWNLDRWPGGSSSGTGSGVAAGLFPGGLGTDTGGSVRCPATFSGISGMKQTYGLVPKTGCTALGTSFDHIGPMARSAWDCAAMLSAMAGAHPSDHTTVAVEVPDYTAGLTASLEGLRIGVDRVNTLGAAAADPELASLFDAALAVLADLGATVTEIEIPLYSELTDVTMTGWPAEVLAYHRGDLQSRWSDYGAETRMVMATGALLSAADHLRADRVRQHGRLKILGLFDELDAIVTPTAACGAPAIEGTDLASVVSLVFTAVWNATGFPALSVPMGLGSESMPIGLQVVTPPFADGLALRIGHAYQTRTDHHLLVPPLAAGL
jgi:aspartyl-tRNA(Asn)/glutamyl-tRNA(Gln) amidotransferase subunit A